MSSKSNDQGRAYEYICLERLHSHILKYRVAVIEKNSSYLAALNAWNNTGQEMQRTLTASAEAVIETLFDAEPLIIEKNDENDILSLSLQKDQSGEVGDVRDIIINRNNICWSIGLSLKHNHFAVKHSRLARKLDFGEKWYGIKCSKKYWDCVLPVFNRLQNLKEEGVSWSELEDKHTSVYVPLLNAFLTEVINACALDKNVPRKLIEYLFGVYDFYKIISVDAKRFTEMQAYNLHGNLNQYRRRKPKILIPSTQLPTRIIAFQFKPGSNNTLELCLDGGWQLTFRLHNASTRVEPSLKFDIQTIGVPATIITINCLWK